MCCADCSAPYRSAWSQGKRKKYAYYVCQTKSCESYGKSIPRDKLEGVFEAFLRRLSPTESQFKVVRAMFKDAWDQRATQGAHVRSDLQKQLRDSEKQSDIR
ncbi:zinc ribbon domain-containing protein [Tropicibacter sp. Alg240-R139]|uniref:zinc ribbon domain-containing protein n=1 Tax=Tropicibacter sp. Alg240-R139 TaxID=2305991 RepID=UPI0013DF42E4